MLFILNSLKGIFFFSKAFINEFFCAFLIVLRFFLFKKLLILILSVFIFSFELFLKLKMLKNLSFGPSKYNCNKL